MTKFKLILFFSFLFNGFLNAQVIDSQKCDCDSIQKTKISSKISDKLKAILVDAAMKSKFMDKNDAPVKQKGNITYEFRLKDKN